LKIEENDFHPVEKVGLGFAWLRNSVQSSRIETFVERSTLKALLIIKGVTSTTLAKPGKGNGESRTNEQSHSRHRHVERDKTLSRQHFLIMVMSKSTVNAIVFIKMLSWIM